MPQKTLDEARVDEIRRFAAKHCGLEIHPNANKATAMQRLSAVWGRPYIEVSEEDVVQASEEIRQAAVPEGRKPEDAWYKIKIARSDRTNEDQFVPVGVNGRMLLIPRGEEVEIRAPYLEVLRRSDRSTATSRRTTKATWT